VPDDTPNPDPDPRPRTATIIPAGLLLAALALVVLYTSHRAFMSPVALVVVAAIGAAALLLQRRLLPKPSTSDRDSFRSPLWLNLVGVLFAVGAVFADVFHLSPAVMLIAALAAVVSFAVSGIMLMGGLRKRRA
jgi:drug/metabolite transporter (DMT)-like permease